MAEKPPLQLAISKSKSLGELSRKLRRVTDASAIDSLEFPSFGGDDPSGSYEEQLEAAGWRVLSWDEERVLVITADGLKLMPQARLHDEVCGAACPFCSLVNCLNFDHPESGTCRHYIGTYDVVNCEFQWHDGDVERLVKQESDRPDPRREDACEWACEVLRRAIGEVTVRATTDETWVSENWSTGTPVFFAGSAALRKLKQIDRAGAGARTKHASPLSRIKAAIRRKGGDAGGVILEKSRRQEVGIWLTEFRVAGPKGIYTGHWTEDRKIPRTKSAIIRALKREADLEKWEDLSEEEIDQVLSELSDEDL